MSAVLIRRATASDIPALVALLADDDVGRARETPDDLAPYEAAFAARGMGLGGTLMQWAIEEARSRGCVLVQLTSDSSRVDAHRFYERLGFEASHVGFKLSLDPPAVES